MFVQYKHAYTSRPLWVTGHPLSAVTRISDVTVLTPAFIHVTFLDYTQTNAFLQVPCGGAIFDLHVVTR